MLPYTAWAAAGAVGAIEASSTVKETTPHVRFAACAVLRHQMIVGRADPRFVDVTPVYRFVTGVSASSISAQVEEVKQSCATDQVDAAPSVAHGISTVKR
jgi:hypothetical protein